MATPRKGFRWYEYPFHRLAYLRDKVVARSLGVRDPVKRARSGEYGVTETFKDLSPLFDWSRNLVDHLLKVEERYAEMQTLLSEMREIYKESGYYNSFEKLSSEASFFHEGTWGEESGKQIPVLKEISHLDGNREYIEKVSSMGVSGEEKILAEWGPIYTSASRNKTQAIEEALKELDEAVTGALSQSHSRITSYHEQLTQLIAKQKRVQQIIERLHALRPKNVRYFHSYYVVSKVGKDGSHLSPSDFGGKKGEKGLGCDYGGFPLEVEYIPGQKEHRILTDVWWNEIKGNSFQESHVPNKFKKFLDQARSIRFISDNFVQPLDPLRAAEYMISEMSAYIRDLSDGRFCQESKTAVDYIIADFGGFTVAPYRTDKDVPGDVEFPPFDPFNVDDQTGYVKAQPSFFMGKNAEEDQLVSREYRMKMITGTVYEDGTRTPGPLSPAMDRRALHMNDSGHHGFGIDRSEEKPFIHWGRLYYWHGIDSITTLTRNPFPVVSTRGIAIHIINKFKDAPQRQGMRDISSEKLDFGIRPMGKMPDALKPASAASAAPTQEE